ncbi:hypothetical protein [Mangrovihabitans endophyticus]|uniref:hypothetical protein n=1 Tax=Mangrovihabitans endophyticus TaxID=1751298 RepID=UPI00166AD93C|nr:hypothetical protein [Mangrovihabitans endophyticus]
MIGSGGDPRARRDGLGWVTRAVFGDPRLRLTVDAPGAAGDPAAVRYAVVPSLDDARFLLPLASRRVTAASLLAYNALRPARVRASRAAVGLLARAGALGLTRSPVLSVRAPDGVPTLAGELAALLGAPRLHAAIGVRPPDPHHKPTLQLFDDHGRPRGYAKIGWNDGTRAMVRAEVATLGELASRTGRIGDMPAVPRLMHHVHTADREIAIIEPMPRRVRRIRRPATPRTAAMLAVARHGGSPGTPVPFGESTFLRSWRRRAAGAAAATTGGAIIDAAIDALVARDGALPVEFGHWHGDWVPWNMARHHGTLLVWDWENHTDDAPIGFDLAHQAFQTALSTRGRPAGRCADAVDDAVRTHGPALGLDDGRQRFVADAYLVELWLRTYELSGGGTGWNAKLHPALLDVLAARLPVEGHVQAP